MIKEVFELTEKKINVGILIMFILSVGSFFTVLEVRNNLAYLNQNIDSAKHDATTAYAYEVIEYGLKGKTTDEEVKEQINIWIEDDWGAQVGALHLICEEDKTLLYSLMSEQLAIDVCRQTL